LLARLETLGWVRRGAGRVLTFPGDGLAAVRAAFGWETADTRWEGSAAFGHGARKTTPDA